MDDFGYRKDEKQRQFSDLTKRIFLASASLFSIACFIYITINAYYFVYRDKDSNIEVIKSPEGPIKIVEENTEAKGSEDGMKIDHAIYEDIFGNKRGKISQDAKPKIMSNPQPAIAPKTKESDRRLVKNEEKNDNQSGKTNREKIVVFSDNKEQPAKDLLTKENSAEKKSVSPKIESKKSEKRAIRIQVAAMSSEAAAHENWEKINRLYGGLFSGLKPYIEKVDLGKRGTFYRLQIGNFYNQVEAEEFCNKYVLQAQKKRADCIIVE